MRIGVLGTGGVGQTLGGKLVGLGHEVRMGSRTADNPKAAAWVQQAGGRASQGTYAQAASFGELLLNCTAGSASLQALEAAGGAHLAGKILIDVANPLDFSKGMPPTLLVSSHDSLGEQIQRAYPDAKVVKALNTVNSQVMIDPGRVQGGEHDLFICGNDAGAKERVTALLREWFGWARVVDVGDITAARATEAYVLLWLRLWGALGTVDFNVRIVR